MKKILSVILLGSLVTNAGIQAGWKWDYFWDSTINQVLVGYGSLALVTGLGSYCFSAMNQTNVNNAMLDKKILNRIFIRTYSCQSTQDLIEQVNQLHITQQEKDSLVAAMQKYNLNMANEAVNLQTLIDEQRSKINVVLRYEKAGKKLISHSKYAAIGLLIYNTLLRDGQLSAFIEGVKAGMRKA